MIQKRPQMESYFEHGKIPPQALDLEEAVLGAVMIEEPAYIQIADFIRVEMFYKESHQKIYSSIQRLSNNNQPIDILTVTENLRQSGELDIVGGAYYITKLTNQVSSAANIEFHARIILQKFIQRELIRMSTEVIRDAYEDQSDVFDLLSQTETSLIGISGMLIKNSGQKISRLIEIEIKQLQARMSNSNKLVGIGSGFIELDRITNGWQSPDFVVIAARPGMGKSAFGLIAARNACVEFNIPTAFFSLEMSSGQLTQRLMASESNVSFSSIQKGTCQAEFENIFNASGKLSNAKLIIDDTESMSIFELRSKARKLKMKENIGLIVVDYIQLMRGDREKNSNREQEVSSISRGLKSMAKELNLPVIAMAQLSRACELRSDKRPILSDIRESGSIEMDADIVGFLYRPSYYKELNESGDAYPENILELNIAKHRNGAVTQFPIILKFDKEIVKITSFEREYKDLPF